jgi:hypothetical protein
VPLQFTNRHPSTSLGMTLSAVEGSRARVQNPGLELAAR